MAAKRAAIYARISVKSDESVSISRQVKSARNYAAAQGWDVVAVFEDDGVSASSNRPEERKGWSDLLASPERFDVVIIWKVDRLARRVLDFLNAHKALEGRKAAVVAVSDPVDMSNAQGRAFATILAVFGEMEAEAIRARVKAARAELIGSGRVPAGMPPYGYQNEQIIPGDPKSGFRLAKKPGEIEHVEEAVRRYMDGESMYQIAQDFAARKVPTKRGRGTWHNSTLQKIFENPVLAGMTPYNPGNGTKVRGEAVLRGEDGMPVVRESLAVLTLSKWRELRSRMESRTLRKVNGTNPLLSGLVECDRCSARMYRAGKKGGEEYIGRYKCRVCNAYVSNLEAEVERQFLEQHGDSSLTTFCEPEASEYDLREIEHELERAGQEVIQPGADVEEIAERIKALNEVRDRATEEAEATGTSNPFAPWLESGSVTLRVAWAARTGVEDRRMMLEFCCKAVRVKPRSGSLTLAERVSLVPSTNWEELASRPYTPTD